MSLPPFRRALALAAAAAAPALAQQTPPTAPAPPPAPEQKVEITGGRDADIEERRQSTAAKIVIGRDEIDRFGDATVGEVLRRLPGITTPGAPGRGGAPRMRGLGNGYTQMLLDGQRVPAGFSLESLTPDQIERIEILRAPTAETGTQAIAGTINIITREGYQKRMNDIRLGIGVENGEFAPGGSWTHNDSAGNLIYNFTAGAFNNHRASTSQTQTVTSELASGAPTLVQDESAQARDQRSGLNLSGRLQWRLGELGDSLQLTPTLFHSEAHSNRATQLTQSLAQPAVPPPYDSSQTGTDSRYTVARLNALWKQRLGESLRAETSGGFGGWRSSSDSLRNEYDVGQVAPARTLIEQNTTRERSANLNLKLSSLLGGGDHSLVGGTEVEGIRRTETRFSLGSGATDGANDTNDLQADSLRLAAYLQDEWTLSPAVSAQAGLRWEGITTRGEALDGSRPVNRSSVLSPLVHMVWRPDPKSKDQVRLSLTSSYRPPSMGTLIAQRAINPKYSADETNTSLYPDRIGNPDLKPELARGIDLALERYLPGGGVLSANLFHRRISDLMRTVTSRTALDVPWSEKPRFVAQTQNIGSATTTGLELEAKFRLDQAVDGALPVELRNNLSVFHSKVDSVPGPDNRLDQQAAATANIGADYRLRSVPLTLGGTFNWVPSYRTQESNVQVVTAGTKRIFDAFALWTFRPGLGLRLMASNLAAEDYVSSNQIDSPESNRRDFSQVTAQSYINWQLRLELKL